MDHSDQSPATSSEPPEASGLPLHLRERCLWRRVPKSPGQAIVYWMRTACRIDENPALDVALWLARHLDLPLLVYQGLSDHYRFASDRHHTFMLEGARDVQLQLAERGISYAFCLDRPGDRAPRLIQLASQAAWVITEEMPTDPARRFLRQVLKRSDAGVVTVDTACLVPMRLTSEAPTRAFQFRQALSEQYARRIREPWPQMASEVRPYSHDRLPFSSLSLQDVELAELVAACRIDHGVPPVVGTPGGSRAGYRRWEEFRRSSLASYARRRNDPLADASSRMSAYLHYGMVSPFRLAREAAEEGSAGAEKFLDELLIWRELAYHFCFHRDDHDQWTAVPGWARESLTQAAAERKAPPVSWERLARAATGEPLWDAAQQSLLRLGELHNNVRMTWGKAILGWAPSPQIALAWLIDLNHRFALDGRDPASYGGILWCLGQFDRPFSPAQPIFGVVRTRPLAEHARRLNVAAYQNLVAGHFPDTPTRWAVVGTDLAGWVAVQTLRDLGLDVCHLGEAPGENENSDVPTTQVVERPEARVWFRSWADQHWIEPVEDSIAAQESQRIQEEAAGAWPGRGRQDTYRIRVSRLLQHLTEDQALPTGEAVACRWREGKIWLEVAEGNLQGPFDGVLVTGSLVEDEPAGRGETESAPLSADPSLPKLVSLRGDLPASDPSYCENAWLRGRQAAGVVLRSCQRRPDQPVQGMLFATGDH